MEIKQKCKIIKKKNFLNWYKNKKAKQWNYKIKLANNKENQRIWNYQELIILEIKVC